MSLPKYNRFEKKPRVRTFTGDPRKQTRKPSSGPPKPKATKAPTQKRKPSSAPTQKRKPSSGPPKPSKSRRLRPNFNSARFDIAKKDKKKKNA